ncbi:ParB/RepB/Spo0J family partition protein [Brevibacterium sp. UCMA 11752]|nr:ParB/RepB/Spo0J family partition protein [Brevibacterium sp. UCMA 11752]
MAERRKRGLGRGLGALIPDAASSDRPVDVFFSGGEPEEAKQTTEEPKAPRAVRTDPAASMQSSRRRKPKAGASSASSTSKSTKADAPASESSPAKSTAAKSTTAKSGPAKSASAKKASGSTSSKPAASQTTAKKAASVAKSATAEASAAKAGASGSSSAKSTPAKSSPAKSSAKTSTGAKTATHASSTKAASEAPATDPAERTAESVLDSTADIEAPFVETAEPDVEATPVDSTADRAGEESTQADDVLETHPGVYRSGHEVFDEARQETAADEPSTTDEVSVAAEPSPVSSKPASANEDDDSVANEDIGIAGVDSIPDTEFGEIDVDRIDANPRQPRTFFDEDQLSELVHSIREIGVLQPVVVRQKPSDHERFELIMGERRLRATKDAGLSTIPAIIRYVDDTDLLRDALLENLHRAELNPLEEAAAYGQLLEDFGCTQEELSERIGRSRPQISNTLRLLRLPPLVQRRVAAGVISAGHARAILGLREPEHMEILAQRIVAEGLSVRASEEAVVLLNRGDSMNVSRATTRVDPQFIEVAERLGDRLDTKVNITVGKKKGKLSVEFANQDDLDRILSLLGVEQPAE